MIEIQAFGQYKKRLENVLRQSPYSQYDRKVFREIDDLVKQLDMKNRDHQKIRGQYYPDNMNNKVL